MGASRTAPSAELLAQRLDKLGLVLMAKNARENMYHDYLSPMPAPEHVLAQHLAACAESFPGMATAILALRQEVIDGKFDATKEESDEWAASEEGQKLFKELMNQGKRTPRGRRR